MTEEKNGDGTYREPADVEKVPEYATTTGFVRASCGWLRSGHSGDPWAVYAASDPVAPPGPYHWQLLSTQALPVKVERTTNKDGTPYGDKATVLLVWTWLRRVED